MKLQDLHVEPLFESEFVLVANRARIGNGTVRLASLQHEQWVLPETNMGSLQRTADHPASAAVSAVKISLIPIRW